MSGKRRGGKRRGESIKGRTEKLKKDELFRVVRTRTEEGFNDSTSRGPEWARGDVTSAAPGHQQEHEREAMKALRASRRRGGKKKKRGGAREGAGRPRDFSEAKVGKTLHLPPAFWEVLAGVETDGKRLSTSGAFIEAMLNPDLREDLLLALGWTSRTRPTRL